MVVGDWGSMELRPTVETDAGHGISSAMGAQPWWRGSGFGGILPMGQPDISSTAASIDITDTRLVDSVACDDEDGVDKEIRNMGAQAGPDGNYVQQQQQLQPVSSVMPSVMPEYLGPHVQMELGQSVACAAYPYPEPYYAGLVASYGPQALVHSQLSGPTHTRMPLPLEMTEEPVYVNAKQYHGILRRRQSRAKLELEKKLIKARKPYLHESRHQHALRRARGCGGRFLNTKKEDATVATSSSAGKTANSCVSTKSCSSSSPETMHPVRSANQNSANTMLEVGRAGLGDMFDPIMSATNNEGYEEHSGFQLSNFHTNPGERVEEGEYLGQQRGSILASRASHRAFAIK